MDEILRRLLVVEKEADEILRRAEEDAEKILNESRRKVNEDGMAFRQETAELVAALIQKKIAEAEVQKAEALAQSSAELAERQAEFKLAIEKRLDQVVAVLAATAE